MNSGRNSQLFENKLKAGGMSDEDIESVMLAYRLSKYGHRNQLRADGRRCFGHPKRTTLILMDELHIYDAGMLIAALLHDILEDSFILTLADIKRIFGEEVARAVDTLSKRENEPENIYHIGILVTDAKIQTIKLADRLDNLQDMNGFTPERKRKYIEETVVVYLPLAERVNPFLHKEMTKALALMGRP